MPTFFDRQIGRRRVVPTAPTIAIFGLSLAASLSCGRTFDENEQAEGLGAVTTSACANHSVQVLDLHADFRDIWAGRETPETGKQADPSGQVSVDFSTTVQPSLIAATFTPVDTAGRCSGTIAATPGTAITGTAVWGTLSSDVMRPTVPAPYNVFVQDTISGVVSAGGSLAAGGDVSLSSFSVNGTVREPVGLTIGGRVALTNGSISGDATYGVASTIPPTVTVSGKTAQLAFSVAAAFQDLQALSALLGGEAPNGTTQSSGGNLQLVGGGTGLNVFQISAAVLAQSSSISINVPTGAGALINVTGTSVDLVSKGISLQGATPSTILWNFTGARFLNVSSISLSGSILAPRAHLAFDSGNINGTIVARSFFSSGSGSLQHAPLNVPKLFGASTPSSVAFKAAHSLVGGCLYQFRISNNTTLTSGNACLSAALGVTFRVAAVSVSTPAGRELMNSQPDTATHTLGRFTARSGINTLVDAALARYERAIGIATDDLVPSATSTPSATRPGQVITTYQQYVQGYPVLGYGYLVASANGFFRSANGRVAPRLPALPVVPTQTITAATALQKALTFMNVTQAPWVKSPSLFKAPVGALVVIARTGVPAASDFALAWSFRLGKATGIGDPADIQVDAVTGAVIASDPGRRGIAVMEDHAKYNGVQVPSVVDTIYSGQRTFSAAQYKNLDGSLVTTLSSKDVAAGGALITATGIGLDASSVPFGFLQYPIDPTPATPWTATEPDAQSMASAEWALQLANTFLGSLDLKVGTIPWQSADGIGHQKVVVNYVTTSKPDELISFFHAGFSDADTANIYLTIKASQNPVAPDTISHEFSHALLNDLRVGNNLPSMNGIKEAGGIDEGLADLFTIAFNHKNLLNLPDPWSCVNFQGASGPTTSCERNIADPHASESPDLYLDAGLGFYLDYSPTPPALCKDNVNDSCGVHDNSTIVSHWGYLLGVGSAGLAKVPCDLQVTPLSPDPDTAFKMALDIAYLAAGTRTGLNGGLPTAATFAQFRDATMQVAEELVAENVYAADVVNKVALAWAAVGLPPVMTGVSAAEPASNQMGVYPWTTFAWPADGSDGQTGSSWDFQIASGDFSTGLLYQNNSGISNTATRNGQTLTVFPRALPPNAPDTFNWRVRPHQGTTPWLGCYPVYSFVGTTSPDPVNNLAVVSDIDTNTELVLPGPFVLNWDLVRGTAKPNYDVKLSLTDPQCTSGAGVTDLPVSGLSNDGSKEIDQVAFIAQPRTHYVTSVRPIGPPDFTDTPALGPCVSAAFDTTDLQAPVIQHDGGELVYQTPWTIDVLTWRISGGPVKSIIRYYDRDENGACGTNSIGLDLEETFPGPVLCPNCIVQLTTPPDVVAANPTGYCWDVTDVAANGKASPPSPKGHFTFQVFILSPSPGESDLSRVHDNPSPLPGNSYGSDVTFTWTTLPNFAPTPLYGFRLGRWPWAKVLSAPVPTQCEGPFCLFASVDATTRLTADPFVTGTEYKVTGGKASKGRYCWTAWPLFADPANPGQPWARQANDLASLACYTSGPSVPTVDLPRDGDNYRAGTTTCTLGAGCTGTHDHLSGGSFRTGAPITGVVHVEYIPNGQLTGTTTEGLEFDLSACKPQDGGGPFVDYYDCKLSFTIASPQVNTKYGFEIKTFNSDKPDPVRDDSTLVTSVLTEIDTGVCGDDQQSCCPTGFGNRCRVGTAIGLPSNCICLTCGVAGLSCCEFESQKFCRDDSTCDGNTCKAPPPPHTCPTTLDPPQLPPTPVGPRAALNCTTIADPAQRQACLLNVAPATSICQLFVNGGQVLRIGWHPVPNATSYTVTQYGDGVVHTFQAFPNQGTPNVETTLLELPAVIGTEDFCKFKGYLIEVTANDDVCHTHSETSLTGLGFSH